MKNFIVRAITGIVYVVLLVGCTYYGPVTSFFFFSLVAAATTLEFGHIVNNHADAEVSSPINALAGFVLSAATWLTCIGNTTSAKQMFALYAFSLFYIIISELYRKADNPLRNWSLTFASQIYIALPFALLPFISIFFSANGLQYSWVYVIALFVFIWANDTGAYLTGCTLSRYFPAKLFPRISPKKSWVGSIGGGLLTVGIGALISMYDDSLSIEEWMGFALVVVVFGTWGDLVESLLKRQLGIKDSGKILPGHGGLLDRFDSALLAIPASVIYLSLV